VRIPGAGQELALRGADGAGLAPTPREPKAASVDGAPDFAAVLERGIADASQAQTVANEKVSALAKGASDDLHGTMISVKEAEISMKLVGTVRNKLLDTFHELWRINL